MKNSDVQLKICVEGCVRLNDTLWFCAYDFNALFSMSVITKEIKMCGMFPDEVYHQHRLFAAMQLVNRKIYFIPCEAKNIMVYDIDTEKFEQIVLEKEIRKKLKGALFLCAQNYKEYIYMLPMRSACIVRLNTKTHEVHCITEWKSQCEGYVFNENDIYFNKQSVIIDNMLYAPFYNANAILKINCDTLQTKVHKLGDARRGYSGICYDGVSIWLAPTDTKKLVKWNGMTDDIEEISVVTSDVVKSSYPYAGILHYRGKIICAPITQDEDVQVISKNIDILEGRYTFIDNDEENIFYYEADNGILTIMSRDTGDKVDFDLLVDSTMVDGKRMLQGFKTENDRIGVKHFLTFLTNL